MDLRSISLRTAVLVLVTACGGNPGSQGEPGPEGPAGQNGQPGAQGPEGVGMLMLTAAEQPGAVCPVGGVRFVVGADANRDGVLDDSEINHTLTRSVCNGRNGTNGDGVGLLVVTSDESPGANCTAGGTRMRMGRDANGDGTLGDDEVDASLTRYICNGLQGLKGDPGAKGDKGDPGAKGDKGDTGLDGVGTLVVTSNEPAGANCAAGGTRMEGGRDANRNGVLDAGELNVALTRYICNGLKGDKGDPGGGGGGGSVYVRTKVVGPGASDTDSGNALRAAIDGITDGKTWLVKVEPGVYDLGSMPLVLKSGIHLQGSGENTTFLRSSVDSGSAGTVVGHSGAVLSSLSVENTGGGFDSIAIYSEKPDFDFHDLIATARGGQFSYGIHLKGSTGTFENVRAYALSSSIASSIAYGFYCIGCTSSLMESYAEARGNSRSIGVNVLGGTVYLRNVTAYAIGASTNKGVSVDRDLVGDGNVSLVNVEAVGSGGSNSSGLFVEAGSSSARNSVLSATGATSTNEGISSFSDGAPHVITVQNSIVTGATASVNRASNFTVRIGQSQLSGEILPAAPSGGAYACVGNYKQDFTPVVSCP